MRILHIAPLIAPITEAPPGGAELGAVQLAAEQRRNGHAVSMVACRGSRLPDGVHWIDSGVSEGELVPVATGKKGEFSVDAETRKKIAVAERAVFTKVIDALRDRVGEFDVVHTHCYDEWALFELHQIRLPFVHTLSLGPICPWINHRLQRAESPAWARYVAVSRNSARDYSVTCRRDLPHINYGLDFSPATFNADPEDHLIWLGRISPEKGLHTAIDLAVEAGRSLRIFGRVYDEAYFESEIRQRLELPNIEYGGFVPHEEALTELSRGAAFLFPLEWAEPFGYVFIESLAAGTPVLTYARGAAAEIIDHGVTGYLASDPADLRSALHSIDRFDRAACRASVIERFSVSLMEQAYSREYRFVQQLFRRET